MITHKYKPIYQKATPIRWTFNSRRLWSPSFSKLIMTMTTFPAQIAYLFTLQRLIRQFHANVKNNHAMPHSPLGWKPDQPVRLHEFSGKLLNQCFRTLYQVPIESFKGYDYVRSWCNCICFIFNYWSDYKLIEFRFLIILIMCKCFIVFIIQIKVRLFIRYQYVKCNCRLYNKWFTITHLIDRSLIVLTLLLN